MTPHLERCTVLHVLLYISYALIINLFLVRIETLSDYGLNSVFGEPRQVDKIGYQGILVPCLTKITTIPIYPLFNGWIYVPNTISPIINQAHITRLVMVIIQLVETTMRITSNLPFETLPSHVDANNSLWI